METGEGAFDLALIRVPETQRAVEMYYNRFGMSNSISLNEAAARCGVTGAEVYIYVACTDGLGMPETRKCAKRFLDRLYELKSESSDK